MSWINRLISSVRTRKLEEELEREIEFHLEMRSREKTSKGAAAEEARREVLSRFGSLTRTKEACRNESTLAWLAALQQDLRYAARNIRRNPGFTAAAVACLAVGIGANAAIFSFVNALLFPSMPPNVVMVQRASGGPVSYPDYRDWRRLNHVFDEVFAHSPGERLTVGRASDAMRVLGETVTDNYFQVLGVVPALGRMFAAGDDSHPLAVLSYEIWRDHFSRDPAIAGKTVWIGRDAYTIAGVAPASFQGLLAPWSTGVWVTLYSHREFLTNRALGAFAVGARLKRGVTPQQAALAMNGLDAELAREHPDPQRPPHDSLLVARRSGLSGSPVWMVFTFMSTLLMIVVGIIFLIACANVAGLLTARALTRRREILIRLSMGAGRGRLIRQFLTEGLLLALVGAAVGVALALAAGNALAGLMPQSITGGFQFQHGIDARVLAFTLALSLASVLFSALLPALRASDQNLAAAGKTHSAAGGRAPGLRQWLIAGQVAASVSVLVIAGIFVRSFQKALQVDTGFDVAHVLTVDLDLRDLRYPPARNAATLAQVRDGAAGLPGVASVSLADVFPYGDGGRALLSRHGHRSTSRARAARRRTKRGGDQ